MIFDRTSIYCQTQLYMYVYQQVANWIKFLSGNHYGCCDGQVKPCPYFLPLQQDILGRSSPAYTEAAGENENNQRLP